jgi:4-coumarate--CoA ligase
MSSLTSSSRTYFPPVPLYECSIFTRLFSNPTNDPNFVGNFPADAPAYVDAATGTTLTRSRLKRLSLEFGWALTKAESAGGKKAPRMKRGDVALIFSPNSLAYPVVMLGAIAAGLCCTLANNGYTASELAHQYTDSGAKVIITTLECFGVVREMFDRVLGLKKEDWKTKVVIIPDSFGWVSGVASDARSAPKEVADLLRMEEMLNISALKEEEKFDGRLTHETAFMCYSSVRRSSRLFLLPASLPV